MAFSSGFADQPPQLNLEDDIWRLEAESHGIFDEHSVTSHAPVQQLLQAQRRGCFSLSRFDVAESGTEEPPNSFGGCDGQMYDQISTYQTFKAFETPSVHYADTSLWSCSYDIESGHNSSSKKVADCPISRGPPTTNRKKRKRSETHPTSSDMLDCLGPDGASLVLSNIEEPLSSTDSSHDMIGKTLKSPPEANMKALEDYIDTVPPDFLPIRHPNAQDWEMFKPMILKIYYSLRSMKGKIDRYGEMSQAMSPFIKASKKQFRDALNKKWNKTFNTSAAEMRSLVHCASQRKYEGKNSAFETRAGEKTLDDAQRYCKRRKTTVSNELRAEPPLQLPKGFRCYTPPPSPQTVPLGVSSIETVFRLVYDCSARELRNTIDTLNCPVLGLQILILVPKEYGVTTTNWFTKMRLDSSGMLEMVLEESKNSSPGGRFLHRILLAGIASKTSSQKFLAEAMRDIFDLCEEIVSCNSSIFTGFFLLIVSLIHNCVPELFSMLLKIFQRKFRDHGCRLLTTLCGVFLSFGGMCDDEIFRRAIVTSKNSQIKEGGFIGSFRVGVEGLLYAKSLTNAEFRHFTALHVERQLLLDAKSLSGSRKLDVARKAQEIRGSIEAALPFRDHAKSALASYDASIALSRDFFHYALDSSDTS